MQYHVGFNVIEQCHAGGEEQYKTVALFPQLAEMKPNSLLMALKPTSPDQLS